MFTGAEVEAVAPPDDARAALPLAAVLADFPVAILVRAPG
jgi:hypothetical protein